jgi:hypothetical protein
MFENFCININLEIDNLIEVIILFASLAATFKLGYLTLKHNTRVRNGQKPPRDCLIYLDCKYTRNYHNVNTLMRDKLDKTGFNMYSFINNTANVFTSSLPVSTFTFNLNRPLHLASGVILNQYIPPSHDAIYRIVFLPNVHVRFLEDTGVYGIIHIEKVHLGVISSARVMVPSRDIFYDPRDRSLWVRFHEV